MDVLAYIELNALCVIILIMMLLNRPKYSTRSLDQRIFDYLMIANAVTLVLDGLMYFMDGRAGSAARAVLTVAAALYYTFNAVVPMIWCIYCHYMSFGNQRLLRKCLPIIAVPLIVTVIMVICNLKWDVYYFIDDINIYRRGEQFLVISVVAMTYIAASGYLSIRNIVKAQTEQERRDAWYLASFLIWPLFGVTVQLIFYGVSLIYVGSTLAILMLFINVQNRQIFTDDLTGIANRRQFMRELPRRIVSLDRDELLYAVMIDVDDFKSINDFSGHSQGDATLKMLSGMLAEACAPHNDFVARTGGDEFQLLATRKTGEKFTLAEDIGALIERYNNGSDVNCRLEVSCGSAVYMEDGIKSIDALLSASDRRMYDIKSAKKRERFLKC